MAFDSEVVGVRVKQDVVLRTWNRAAEQDPAAAAADLAHAVLFGRAQSALEAVAAGGVGLTVDHARALHFANEMAELRHYAPLIAVEDGLPTLAPGVRELIDTIIECGLWDGQPAWHL